MDYSSEEHACGFDRSQLYSDEGPPISEVVDPWPEMASKIMASVLRWN